MYQSLFNAKNVIISVFLSGLCIKLLDDAIDENNMEYIPYSMCFLCLSCALWKESLSLFFCSYIVGMFHYENLKLISGLKTYQEQIICFVLSGIIVGLKATFSSLLIICIIQLIDDYMDMKEDTYQGKKNWAVMIGRAEVIVITAIIMIISICFSLFKTILCVGLSIIISWVFKMIKKRFKGDLL